MEHFAGIDVSLEQSGVCVVDAAGRIIREAKVASEPEGLVRFFRELATLASRMILPAASATHTPLCSNDTSIPAKCSMAVLR